MQKIYFKPSNIHYLDNQYVYTVYETLCRYGCNVSVLQCNRNVIVLRRVFYVHFFHFFSSSFSTLSLLRPSFLCSLSLFVFQFSFCLHSFCCFSHCSNRLERVFICVFAWWAFHQYLMHTIFTPIHRIWRTFQSQNESNIMLLNYIARIFSSENYIFASFPKRLNNRKRKKKTENNKSCAWRKRGTLTKYILCFRKLDYIILANNNSENKIFSISHLHWCWQSTMHITGYVY